MKTQPSSPRLVPPSGEASRRRASITNVRLEACVDAYTRGAFDRTTDVLARMCDSLAPLDACERVLTPVARSLGDRWAADTCDFATVTLAMGRLHTLLHKIGRAWTPETMTWAPRRVLLAAAPGEQHFFGPAMLAQAFRAAGWDVCAPQGATGHDLVTRVRGGGFELVGLSFACDPNLDGLTRLISDLRVASPSATLSVLVGGRPFVDRPDLAQAVGADGTAPDCAGTLSLADALMNRMQAAA